MTTTATTPTAPIVAPAPRYRHLVAMHPGEGGPETPFFLVAGMFGNVLNLRHLAHQVGTDRPFYGVQAKGLYGDEDPHDDFRRDGRRPTSTRCARCSPRARTSSAASPAAASPPSRWRSSCSPPARRSALLVFLDTADLVQPSAHARRSGP